MTRRRAVAAVSVVLGVALCACPPARAAEQSKARLSAAKVTVSMVTNGRDTIRATYRLSHPKALDGRRVTHRVMPRNGVRVTGVAPGPGVANLHVVQQAGTTTVVLDPGTEAYTLRYRAARDAGTYAVPLLVPELPTARDAHVSITTLLPDGTRLVGAAMPSSRQRTEDAGRLRLAHHGGGLPSAVVAEYGTSWRPTLGDVLSVAALLLLAVVVVGWWRRSHRGTREVSQ